MYMREEKRKVISDLPLSAYLSQTLIAFTLEFDDVFKTKCEAAGVRVSPPSLAMWANVVRFLDKDGVDERQLVSWSGVSKSVIHFMVACLERHGWVTVSSSSSANEKHIHLTPSSSMCQEMWRTTLDDVEHHWQVKFGEQEMKELFRSLAAIVCQNTIELPYYPMFSAYVPWRNASGSMGDPSTAPNRLPLFVLLSQTLIAFSIEYEREMRYLKPVPESLAIYANALQFINEEGQTIRQLAEAAGISKSVLNIILNVLAQNGQLVVEQGQTRKRSQSIRLTESGRRNRDAYGGLLVDAERRWQVMFGEDMINLNTCLKEIASQLDGKLPHYPVAMAHRGGTPTGH